MSSKEKKLVPFIIESSDVEKVPNVKITVDGTILVNGSKYGDYKYVSHLQKQKNGIYSFQSPKNDDVVCRFFVDPENPKDEFPFIEIDTKNHSVSVKDFYWTSLSGKKFLDSYFAIIDPVTESIVLKTSGDSRDDRNEIVVNNIPWKTKFYEVGTALSYQGCVLVIARKRDTQNSLYVNDREWSWPVHKDPEVKKHEEIVNFSTNGAGVVAAVISSTKAERNKFHEYVFVGDNLGAKMEWKTKFDSAGSEDPLNVAVDKNSDNVAVIGMIKGVPTLVIDDVVCKLSSEPHNVEKFRFENGVVFLQYKNALAKEFAETISLLEDAHEIQSYKDELEDSEEKIFMLREIMNKTGLNPTEVLDYLSKYATLGGELKKEREKSEKFFELKNDNAILESQKNYLESALNAEKDKNQELEEMIDDFEKLLVDMDKVVSGVNDILVKNAPVKGVWSSKAKITKDVYEELAGLIGGKIKNLEPQNPPEKKDQTESSTPKKKESNKSNDWFK